MVGLYLATGLLWASWNMTSDFAARMARTNPWWATAVGFAVGVLLWPLGAGVTVLCRIEDLVWSKWKGGDLP